MKKYSEKYINSYKLLSEAQIGFEFEFFSNISYYKTLETLNNILHPVKVHGFRRYHSDFTPDSNNFKLEPDLSGGSNMAEIVTGPLDYFSARQYLLKILKFIQENGYTNDKCSLHINISFKDGSDKTIKDLSILKAILRIDEEEIYNLFPSRKNNIYAKSVKKLIPYKDYDFSNIGIGTIQNNIRFPKDKYFGINFLNVQSPKEEARIEYRYIGGKDYEYKTGEIMELMDKFIIDCHQNIGSNFTKEDVIELEKFLSDKITNFKNFVKYDNFLVEFPTVKIQVDQQGHYDIVSAYYDRIYKKVFELIDSTEGLKECVVNFFTTEQKIEVVGATFKSTFNISGYDFINCNIVDGIFTSCNFIATDAKNCEIKKSTIQQSTIDQSKLINCNVEMSDINDCFFMAGYLNGEMNGGIFRSGKVGPYGRIGSETKIVTGKDSFFGTTHDDIDKEQKGKKFSK